MHQFGFRGWLAIYGWMLATAATCAPQDSTLSDETIELPKYVVTDVRELPPPESWRYAEIPGFEVLSNASDSASQRMLEEFQRFNAALGVVWPALQPKSSVPMVLILCRRGNKFEAFVPTHAANMGAGQGLASLFLKGHGRNAIVVDTGTMVLNLTATDTSSTSLTGQGVITSGIEVDHDKQLYREYVRFLLARAEPRSPAWLEEGISQLLMGMKVTSTQIEFARLEDPNLISIAQANALAEIDAEAGVETAFAPAEDREFQAALGRSPLMGFPEMFAVQHDSQLALNPIGSAWAKQCYAFVHMCLYGDNKKYQRSFLQFVGRLAQQPASEALFQECFGLGYRAFGTRMRGYIQMAAYQSMEWRVKKGGRGFESLPAVEFRDATEAEVGRIKGETLMLAGHQTKARDELIAPYIRGDRDPRLLAALGLYERANGDDARARKFLDAAVTGKVVRPEAYLELAQLRYADALAQARESKVFTTAQVAGITQLLQVARSQPMHPVAVYELLAETWLRSSEKITREDAAVLIQGTRLFPNRLKLVYQTAGLCADANLLDAAHALTAYGIAQARDPATRARFEQLKAMMPPLSPTPAAGIHTKSPDRR